MTDIEEVQANLVLLFSHKATEIIILLLLKIFKKETTYYAGTHEIYFTSNIVPVVSNDVSESCFLLHVKETIKLSILGNNCTSSTSF